MSKLKRTKGKSKVFGHENVCVDDFCASFGLKNKDGAYSGNVDKLLTSGPGGVYEDEQGEVIEEKEVSPQNAEIMKQYLQKLVKEGKEGKEADYSLNPLAGDDCRDFSRREYDTLEDFADKAETEKEVELNKLLNFFKERKK